MSSIQDPSSKANKLAPFVLSPDDVAVILGRSITPHFALRSDGAWVLSVEDLPPGTDLTHRKIWTTVVLTSAERDLLLRRLSNAEAETAAILSVRIAKPKSEDDSGSSE